MRICVFSFLLAAVAAAQTPEAPKAEAPKKARLEGSVVSLTGEAIPRATVRLIGGALATVTADDAGKFVFEEITPGGNYRINAQRPGYLTAQYGAHSATGPGAPLTLVEGQVLKGLTISMTPQGTISGKVTDRDNDPIAGAVVSALRVGYQGGVRALLPAGLTSGKTDDKGEYRMANLAPGRYYLAVMDSRAFQGIDNFLKATIDKSKTPEVNAITYYPNVADFPSAQSVNVASGADLHGMDIRMRASRTFAIRGKVVNTNTGAPASGLLLRAAPKQPDGQPLDGMSALTLITTHAAQDGTFELNNALVGDWIISAIGALPALGTNTPYNLYGSSSVSVRDADVTGVVLQVGPGASLSGSFRFETGDFKTVFAAPPPDALTLALGGTGASGAALLAGRPLVALTEIGGGLQAAQVGEDGTFKFASANRGRFSLSVSRVPPKYYVKSVSLGSSDVTHSFLDLSEAGGSLDILLGDKPAELSGNLKNEKNESMTGFLIALWSKEPEVASSTNGVRTAYTDQNGAFQFKSLPPGEYFMAAWEDADAEQLQNRDLLAMFSNDGAKIKLAEGAKESAEAKLITSEKLAAAVAKLP